MTSVSLPADDIGADSNPFPGRDKKEWTDNLSAALAAETNMPRHITDEISVYFVRPKDLLFRPRGSSQYQLRPEALTREGGLTILNGIAHGFAGGPGEYNERIRSSFHSPVRADADPHLTLPPLQTGLVAGRLAPFLTTIGPVTPNHLARLLDTMESSLDAADSLRNYRLVEDLAAHGQQTRTLHVPLNRRILEDGPNGPTERTVVELMAIKGANRSRARLTLHSLTAKAIVFGIQPYQHMGVPLHQTPLKADLLSADPRYWVPILADLLKQAYANPDHPGHELARRAARVATVPLQLVIGADNLVGFHNTVFDPNRVDHRRPPLDYGLAEKAASDVRALLRKVTAVGGLTEAERAWLAGEGPDPAPRPGESRVDARDRRDVAIFNLVFPQDPARRALVREVIGEPAPYSTTKRHVENRLRMISAVISDGYGQRWNPRVLDGLLSANAIKNGGFVPPQESWSTLLDRAALGDLDALDAFIVTRGIHWLAEHKIVEADRGSIGAQAQDGDEAALRIRRGAASVRTALKLEPARAIALMRELARATGTGTHPRQVDVEGEPLPDTTATRTWFDQAFPKTSKRVTKKNTPTPTPGTIPKQPDPTPQELLHKALSGFQDVITDDVPRKVVTAFTAARSLHDAAASAGLPAFPDNVADIIVPALINALNAVRNDVRTLSALLTTLQGGAADTDDFESACDAYLKQVADQ